MHRKLLPLFISIIFLSSQVLADSGLGERGLGAPSAVRVQDEDGSPSLIATRLIFGNGSVAKVGSHAHISTVPSSALTSTYLTLAAPNQVVTQSPGFTGTIGVGTTASTAALIEGFKNFTPVGAVSVKGLYIDIRDTADTNGVSVRGVYVQPYALGTKNYANVVGNLIDVYSGTSGITTSLVGADFITDVATGTATNRYGIIVRTPALYSGGNIINNYGIYLENQTGGDTLNYAIYSLGGDVELTSGNITTTGTVTMGSLFSDGGSFWSDGAGNVSAPSLATSYLYTTAISNNPPGSEQLTIGSGFFDFNGMNVLFSGGPQGYDLNTNSFIWPQMSTDFLYSTTNGFSAFDLFSDTTHTTVNTALLMNGVNLDFFETGGTIAVQETVLGFDGGSLTISAGNGNPSVVNIPAGNLNLNSGVSTGDGSSNITLSGGVPQNFVDNLLTNSIVPFISLSGYYANFSTPIQVVRGTGTSYKSQMVCMTYNGSSYTSRTSECRTAFGTAFTLLADTNDYVYIGMQLYPWTTVYFDLATLGAGLNLKWEYYNGGWVDLAGLFALPSDTTSAFSSDGYMTFDPYAMADWSTTAINGTTAYWVRISTDAITTAPTCYKIASYYSQVPALNVQTDTSTTALYTAYTGFNGIYNTSPSAMLDIGMPNTAGIRTLQLTTSGDTGDPLMRLSRSAAIYADIWYDGSQGDLYIDNGYNNTAGEIYFRTKTAGTAINNLILKDTLMTVGTDILLSAKNLYTDTTTGMKIGTATNQKLGFFNSTPIVQVVATTDLGTVLSNLGLRAAGTAYPITTTGNIDFGGCTNFEIQNGANPTCDVAGEIAINSTDKTLEFHDGTRQSAIPVIHLLQGNIGTGNYNTDPDVWILDLQADRFPHGIYITKIYVDCNEADPATELDADLMYCDAVGTGAFPGASATVIKAIDTTTGNFSDAAVNTAVATGKSVYIRMNADTTSSTTIFHVRVHYYIPTS